MSVVVVTPPTWPLVSLEAAKAHLRVETDDDDDLIDGYLLALSEELDGPGGDLGRAIGVQTLEVAVQGFDGLAELPYPPVRSISAVSYRDQTGAWQAIDPATYEFFGQGDYTGVRCAPGHTWPTTTPSPAFYGNVGAVGPEVRIRFEAGYDNTPARIRQAILLRCGDLYANRESQIVEAGRGSATPNPTADRLLNRYRAPVVG